MSERKLPMLKIRMNPVPKGSSDFQQFAPFRDGVNKLLEIEIMGFLSDTNHKNVRVCNFGKGKLNSIMVSKINLIALLISLSSFIACQGQSNTKNMDKESLKNNPLLCDIETGMCETSDGNRDTASQSKIQSTKKSVRVVYYTDPICSSCWGIEPQLRKLKLEYGNFVEIEYRMGGLLPDWSYNSGGIGKPSDVAEHWDEVSVHYDMPIDGDVWLEDPLHSSYPPSIAFKAAQMQDNEKAILFLREIREMVFLQKKNITKWENLEVAAKKVGLNMEQFKTDYEGKAKELFNEDLKLGRELGVRGFPTMFFFDESGNQEIVYGSRPYPFYEMAILKLNPNATKSEYSKNWETLFSKYPTLTAKEFSELSGTPRDESEKQLNELVLKGDLEKHTTKNGSIWTTKKMNR